MEVDEVVCTNTLDALLVWNDCRLDIADEVACTSVFDELIWDDSV